MRPTGPPAQIGGQPHFDVPSARGFIAVLDAFRATGGTAPGEIVGRLLEEFQRSDAVSLAKLIDTGQAFGFEWRNSLWIPMFQFDPNDLALKCGVQAVRAELPPRWSGWQVANWFAAAHERLNGHSPADMLDADLEAVVQAAQLVHASEGFLPPLGRSVHTFAAPL